MSKSVDALVNPELLIWARESMHFDQETACKKISESLEKLRDWENGTKKPTFKQLLKIAKVYKRPVLVFYLPKPPNKYDKPFSAIKLKDRRILGPGREARFSTALMLELRKAEFRYNTIVELRSWQPETENKHDLRISRNLSPARAAALVRNQLGITVEEQLSWKDEKFALQQWRRAIEKLSILTFQTGFYHGYKIPTAEVRGIAINLQQNSIIILNQSDKENARIFSLIHEFCHVLLGSSGLRNIYDADEIMDAEEIYCNDFAGNFLVPSDALLDHPIVKQYKPNPKLIDLNYDQLSKDFKVSAEVILRRLLKLNLITQSVYKAYRKSFTDKTTVEEKSRGGNGKNYYKRFLNWHGEFYVSTIMNAYYDGFLNLNDVSSYLGAKLKHIDNIGAELLTRNAL